MKKPIEVLQRVSIRINGKLCGRGELSLIREGVSDNKYQVALDGGGWAHVTLENLRRLKPKPKRVCHCNREPDRWASFNIHGVFICTSPTKESAARMSSANDSRHVAPVWIGPKEKIK